MTNNMLPQSCVDHKLVEAEILARLNTLEDDVKELYVQLKDKINDKTFSDLVDRSTKEMEEIKEAIVRLNSADIKHSEALVGIHQILKGFKETQDLMRQDYSKLAECYTQSSVHIASITAILAERAKKDDVLPKIIEAPTSSNSNDPWYVRLINKSKALTYAIVALITTIIWILLSHFSDIVTLLQSIFGK